MRKFGECEYKTSFKEEEPWKMVDIKRKDCIETSEIELSNVEPVCKIKKPKYDDIKKQLKFIPEVHRECYETLTHE